MKVLVTGATGFIGKWVMKELDASEHVAVAFVGDVRDERAFQGFFTRIIHLASLVTHRQLYTAEVLHEVNVRGMENLLRTYPEAKIVYVSTIDVVRETLTDYAETKLAAEKLAEKYGNCVIVRLPSVFGPEQRQVKLIPLLFQKYSRGSECTIINNNLNEYIYVEDVAKQLVGAMDQNGIITLEGFKIKNLDLAMMIQTICQGKGASCESPEEQKFFIDLKRCYPAQWRSS